MSDEYNGMVNLKNIIIDFYLYVRYELSVKNTNLFKLIRLTLILNYLFLIIKEILCMNTIDTTTRLYLFDIALFIGGVRQYNNFVNIIVYLLGLYLFAKLHTTRDESLMRWTQLFRVLRGECQPSTMTLFKFNMHKFDLFVRLSKLFYRISLIIYFTFGKNKMNIQPAAGDEDGGLKNSGITYACCINF